MLLNGCPFFSRFSIVVLFSLANLIWNFKKAVIKKHIMVSIMNANIMITLFRS